MKARLIIFKLNIKSSYNQNIELLGDKVFDTLQFFIKDETIIRVKTFAIDHDIHIHKVNLRGRTIKETIDFLISSTNNHYGDVVDKTVDLDIKDMKDDKVIKSLLVKEDLTPYLDITPDFLFWNPDNKKYSTQSRPM